MKFKCLFLFSFFSILIFSCSQRYRVYIRAIKKLNKNEIIFSQFDSVINKFYTIQNGNFKLPSKLKLSGSYVKVGFSDYYNKNYYKVLHFTDSCFYYSSNLFYETPSNIVISNIEGAYDRYTENSNELIVEYLLYKDFNIYNIYRYVEISNNGDTLTFYRSENLQIRSRSKKPEVKVVFIYNSSLTAFPKI